MLTIDQLEEGKIYITVKKAPGYVFLCKGDSTCTNYMYAVGKKIPDYGASGHLSSISNSSFSHYEEASYKDAEWLRACIAAGKGVEWNDNMLIPQYEIY